MRSAKFETHDVCVLVRVAPISLLALAVVLGSFVGSSAIAGQAAPVAFPAPLPKQRIVPPREPRVKPVINRHAEIDIDGDKIDDKIKPVGVAHLRKDQSELIRVELVFSQQITQAQLDAFGALGGTIDYIYESVSYGWSGVIARNQTEKLPAALGDTLVVVAQDRPAKLHLLDATRNGRARPVWVPGFAGSASGFAGNNNITVAILDTGFDASHPDLGSARMEYWHDYTADGEPIPVDYGGHGSHVSGIVLGTGQTVGANPTQVSWTDNGDLTGVTSGSFYPSPIHFPAGQTINWSSVATWVGGGSTTLYPLYQTDGGGSWTDICNAVDGMVTQRIAHNIKVVNMSLGMTDAQGHPTTYTLLRDKVNTMVNNGIVACCSAGNDGPTLTVGDPGRAGLALTVAAANRNDQLTQYTSLGFTLDGSGTDDMKPDLMAPGGSQYFGVIRSVDSNNSDAENSSFADVQANDYTPMMGTSMASPFAAGSAALVIDALQQSGVTWDFNSATHAKLVKALLCATATESNAVREASAGANPALGRAAAPKDIYEGYGMLNVDAAIECVMTAYSGGTLSDSTAGGIFDRRAWGRRVSLVQSRRVVFNLATPSTGDFDLYLYSAAPDAKGNPVILSSSTNSGNGTTESISYTPSSTQSAYLVIKRVSGSGSWTLSTAATQLAFTTQPGGGKAGIGFGIRPVVALQDGFGTTVTTEEQKRCQLSAVLRHSAGSPLITRQQGTR
ncbi:MAG TPA: S8 family serine peptidase [Planctomycetota bacterium]|jgi:subtilisin family serine protease